MTPPDFYPILADIRSTLGGLKADGEITFQIETGQYFFEWHIWGYERLVVTFEDAMLPPQRPDRFREPWGAAPFWKRRISTLTVKPKRRTWYSDKSIVEGFEQMRPLLDRFRHRYGYGMSMGGFAALTFADLLRLDRVVAMAPQSTYRKVGNRRETRFRDHDQFDHSHPYGDAVDGCRNLPEAWLFFDRFERFDTWHAHRFVGPQFHYVHTPFSAHGVPPMLRDCDALRLLPELLLYGTFDAHDFYQRLRHRRSLTQYQNFLRVCAATRPWLRRRLGALLADDEAVIEADIKRAAKATALQRSSKNDQNLS